MTPACRHPLCAIIGGACSLATRRSRGCRPNVVSREVAPALIDEVRELLGVIEARADDVRAAATRLATIVRREALEDRNLVALFESDEPDLAPVLARLCRRP